MYQPVEDNEKFDNDAHDTGSLMQKSRLRSWWNLGSIKSRQFSKLKPFESPRSSLNAFSILLTIVNLVFFVAASVMIYLSYHNVKNIQSNKDNRLIKLTSTYSPVFDKIPISLKNVHQNGTFWPQNPPSLFQLPPSPSVDEAWERLADTHAVAFTASEMLLMGKDPSELWPWPSSYHIPQHPFPTSENTYMALPHVFHQIHCLNMMRKMIYQSYYGEFWTKSKAFPVMEHLGHCQYILLGNLMCHADLEMITFGKVRGTPGPFPDFGVQAKCRDWDTILKWKEENQVNVSDEEWEEIKVTPQGIGELDPVGRTLPPL